MFSGGHLVVSTFWLQYEANFKNVLSRYCECFASGIYCDGCNCVNCFNNVENEAARREAVEATLERNPNAFRPKIASSPHGTRDNRVCSLTFVTGRIVYHALFCEFCADDARQLSYLFSFCSSWGFSVVLIFALFTKNIFSFYLLLTI
jgi:hypothetical protein